MKSRAAFRSITLAVAFGVLAAGCATTPEEDPMVVKMNDLDRRLERIERVMANQSLLDLAQQLQAMQTDVRTLRGQLEELQYASDNVKNQQRGLYTDLDQRLKALEGGMPRAVGEGEAGAVPVPAGSDRMNYQAAFDLLKAGQYEKATAAFQRFLATFPDSALADNAQYWLGESYYVTRRYDEALKAFRTVVDKYPESRKLADAWLKIGYTQYELKAWKAARDALTRVQREYPDSGAATEAAKRLQKMTSEGH
jgi:tol-pal system protein YbgF